MKKTLLILTFFSLVFCIFSQDVKINKSKSRAYVFPGNVVVDGYTSEKLYLGVTIVFKKSYIQEYDFKDVPRVKGSFEMTFTAPAQYIKKFPEGVTWIVSLWEKKVRNCGCEYCKKNGFHLEGRVSRDTWYTTQ
jgi:hypothetical protein